MKSSPTLLITDDDHDFRESLGSLFCNRGFNTVMAEDGCQACEVVNSREIHIVLIDFHMPRMTGLEALRKIKQINPALPVILMSARLSEEMSDQILAANAFSVHSKPIDIGRIRGDVLTAMQTIYDWTMDW